MNRIDIESTHWNRLHTTLIIITISSWQKYCGSKLVVSNSATTSIQIKVRFCL